MASAHLQLPLATSWKGASALKTWLQRDVMVRSDRMVRYGILLYHIIYTIVYYVVYIYIYLYTIACYIILYYIFFTLYSITSITLYFDIVLYHVVFYFAKLYKYTILYRIMLHHFTSLHFASFFSIILHCNTVHCIALFFCFVLCCVVLETLVYRSATNMWKKRGDWSAPCAIWCCSCLLWLSWSHERSSNVFFFGMQELRFVAAVQEGILSWRTWKSCCKRDNKPQRHKITPPFCFVLPSSVCVWCFFAWGSTCIEILEDKLFAHWLDDRPPAPPSQTSHSQTMHSSHILPMGVFLNIEATATLIGQKKSGIYHFLPCILEQTKVKLWKSYPSLPSRSLDLWETRSS